MANINDRVCIVGAGPAGLTAAMYLEKKGYKNITIYESQKELVVSVIHQNIKAKDTKWER